MHKKTHITLHQVYTAVALAAICVLFLTVVRSLSAQDAPASGTGETVSSVSSEPALAGSGMAVVEPAEVEVEETTASMMTLELVGGLASDAEPGYPSNIAPTFVIPFTPSIADENDLRDRLTVVVTDNVGNKAEVQAFARKAGNTYRVTIVPPSAFVPGTYRMQAWLSPSKGMLKAVRSAVGLMNSVLLIDQYFDWGRVAVNIVRSDASVAALSVATIAADGAPSCAGALTVTIAGHTTTDEDSCGESLQLALPSGETDVRVSTSDIDARSVALRLRDYGDHAVSVNRQSVSRVATGMYEEMTMNITFNRGVRGSIREQVPPGFDVLDVTPPAAVESRGAYGTVITWDGQWNASEMLAVKYAYRASAAAPLMALFGPLALRGEATDSVAVPAETVEPSSTSTSSVESSEQSSLSAESSEGSSSASPESSASSAESSEQSSTGAVELPELEPQDADTSSAASSASLAIPTEEPVPSGEIILETSWLQWLVQMAAAAESANSSVVFDEEAQWQLLVTEAGKQREPVIGTQTLVFEREAAVFDANSSPSFRLIDAPIGEFAGAVDENGHLKKEIAYTEILKRVLTTDDVKQEIAAQIVDGVAADLAVTALADADVRSTATYLAGGSTRTDTLVETVSEAIRNDDVARDVLADIALRQSSVDTIVSAIATDSTTESIAYALAQLAEAHDALGTEDVKAVVAEAIVPQASALEMVERSASAQLREIPELSDTLTQALQTNVNQEAQPIIRIALKRPDGTSIDSPAFHFEVGSVVLVIDPIRNFQPGIYTAEITATNPLSGDTQTYVQQFAWGVLALNADKDLYQPGQTANLAFGVLDDRGEMVCDAHLSLDVTSPDGDVVTLSTSNGFIYTSDGCTKKEAGYIEPDFFATVPLAVEGTYRLRLTATFEQKVRTLQSTIVVSASPHFIVERKAATRLWPFAPSPMTVTVTFLEDVHGSVTDTVPAGFVVSDVNPSSGAVYPQDDGTTHIRWLGSWYKGQTATFKYQYDAPNISPEFYLIGPLIIGSDLPFPGSTASEPDTLSE